MKLGTHCVLYADAIARDLEGTLQTVQKSGCQGVEIGARFFGTDRAEELSDQLAKHNIELSGLHTLLKVPDLFETPEAVYEAYQKPVAFARMVGTKNLVSSGMVDFNAADFGDPRLLDTAEMKKAAHNLNAVVRRIYEESGIIINYHNHVWEFANQAIFFQILLQEAPDLHLGMDTGWVTASGYDPVEYITQYSDRIQYFHLRDCHRAAMMSYQTFQEKQHGFANVGEGDMNLTRLAAAIERYCPESWGILEYEFGEKDYARYVKAVAYFKGLLAAVHTYKKEG